MHLDVKGFSVICHIHCSLCTIIMQLFNGFTISKKIELKLQSMKKDNSTSMHLTTNDYGGGGGGYY